MTSTARSSPMAGVDAPSARGILAMAWPMMLKAIFLHGAVVIDGLLVAPLGEASLAAMGLAAATAGMILGVIFAFSHAMQIRTAQAAGVGDPVYMKSVIATGLAISATIGIAGVIAICPSSEFFGELRLYRKGGSGSISASV